MESLEAPTSPCRMPGHIDVFGTTFLYDIAIGRHHFDIYHTNYVVRDNFANLSRSTATTSRIPRNTATAGPTEKSK